MRPTKLLRRLLGWREPASLAATEHTAPADPVSHPALTPTAGERTDASPESPSETPSLSHPLTTPTRLHLDRRQGDQHFEQADYYEFRTGSGSRVVIRWDEWIEHDPGLERPKSLDEKFYNEVSPQDFARLFWRVARTRNAERRWERFEFLIRCAYARRESSEAMRALAEDLCRTLFAELADAKASERFAPYVIHSTLLAERGEFAQAIALCEQAAARGLSDGTMGGYAGRIRRLRRQQLRIRAQSVTDEV